MARFVGIKHDKVCVVSDKPFDQKDILTLEVPIEFENVSSMELIANYRVYKNQLQDKKSKKHTNQLRVAFVGNWMQKCGIATYNFALWPEVAKHLKDYKLFIEESEIYTHDIHQFGNQVLSDQQVLVCWKRGQSLQKLIAALKEYNPDIVLISHEYGIFPNARYWLSMLSQLSEYRVITTLHSVFHHKDKTIIEAAIPEIIVHLEGAKKVLKEEKQITGQVYVIPHGCSLSNKERLWNFYKSDHTFIIQGFGFKYKNFQAALETVAILKKKFPDIFFTGLFAETPYAKMEHQLYYNELMLLADQLNIQNNISLIRGFQSEEVINSFLGTNQAAIFPYNSHPQHEVYGSSGSARLAMSAGIPVITSNAHLFSDLPTIKTNSAQEIADALEKLWSNSKEKEKQIAIQNDYLLNTTWEKVALMHLNIFEN